MEFAPEFWEGLLKIIFVNILLSGDNAVVIALASRSLPVSLRSRAIWFGAVGAVILRLIFSLFIVQLMAIPYLKLIGALLLIWIGVKMLVPEHDDAENGEGGGNGGGGSVWNAIKTIIIADAVMSLDNVIAIAAAANGDFLLILIGLVMSVPLIIYGSTLILHFLIRYPVLVMAGAGLIGWIAGEIWVSDPAIAEWTEEIFQTYGHWLEWGSAAAGAAVVVILGKIAAARAVARRRKEDLVDLAAGKPK
jgi:YjbE family integral membrane protein